MDNYEALCQSWAEKFTRMDHDALTGIPGVRRQNGDLVLAHLDRQYAASCATGAIRCLSGEPVDVTRRLNIYTLFGYWQPAARLSGQWVSFRQLRGAAPFDDAFRRGVTEPFARLFSGQVDVLNRAMTALGALPLPVSDAGWQVDAFACIPVRFLFWDGDDEFPAQGNLLFDTSATDFIHQESIVTIAMATLQRLVELAGLEPDAAML